MYPYGLRKFWLFLGTNLRLAIDTCLRCGSPTDVHSFFFFIYMYDYSDNDKVVTEIDT